MWPLRALRTQRSYAIFSLTRFKLVLKYPEIESSVEISISIFITAVMINIFLCDRMRNLCSYKSKNVLYYL